ncbi:MAG: 8-oxo-dGTP diphosphatase MutT [Clostridia bacterium]|nr:8-oxo-dGTP diphosphatase MutT [Clostridia bacterium]
MKTIQVVAAIIREDGRIFAAQRGYGSAKDGWEFPGGKIEPGETPEQALVREIREELNAEIAVGEKLTQVEWDYPDFHLSMGCYWCAVASGALTLREHESARWLHLSELDAVDWLPADRVAVAAIKRQAKA